jgi:hypothetical protein
MTRRDLTVRLHSLKLKPRISLGPFSLGSPVKEYIETFDLEERCDETDATGWTRYDIRGFKLCIYAEAGIIASISCSERLIYRRKNLIDMTLDALCEALGTEPTEIGESVSLPRGPQIPVEFDGLNLQAWLAEGRVITLFAYFLEES